MIVRRFSEFKVASNTYAIIPAYIMTTEAYRAEGTAPRELDGRSERTITKLKRTENPLLYPLIHTPANFSRFSEIVGDHVQSFGGAPVTRVYAQEVLEEKNNYGHHFTVIEIPYTDFSVVKYLSLKNLVVQTSENQSPQEQAISQKSSESNGSAYMITTDVQEIDEDNPYLRSGLFFKGADGNGQKDGVPDAIPSEGTLELRYGGDRRAAPSEAMTAYETIISALILAGEIDISSEEKMQETLPFRKQLFMNIYISKCLKK